MQSRSTLKQCAYFQYLSRKMLRFTVMATDVNPQCSFCRCTETTSAWRLTFSPRHCTLFHIVRLQQCARLSTISGSAQPPEQPPPTPPPPRPQEEEGDNGLSRNHCSTAHRVFGSVEGWSLAGCLLNSPRRLECPPASTITTLRIDALHANHISPCPPRPPPPPPPQAPVPT